jgi:hypothetical protein
MKDDDFETRPEFLDVRDFSEASAPPDDDQQLETVISDALKQLSIGERERVYFDIHGVADEIKETPEFVYKKLDEFHDELEKAKSNRALLTAAYHLAEALSSEFVEDKKLRISFLRTDDFDPKKAAERMVRYFDFKQSLFGTERLCKTITYADLGSDIPFLEMGPMQVLPVRDGAGRPVVIMFPSQQEYTRVGAGWTNIVVSSCSSKNRNWLVAVLLTSFSPSSFSDSSC